MQRIINKEEFNDWKQNTVTQTVFEAIKDRRDRLKEVLAGTAGMDSGEDRKITGMITAYNTLLLVDFEELSDE